MHTATKRTLVTAAALAAAGLFGSLPHHGSMQAQGVPVQHHDVALVDTTVTDDIAFDNAFWNSILGPNGAEQSLFDALGGAPTPPATMDLATALLDTNTANPAFAGDFNGAESRLTEGLFVDYIYGEDQLNQALGLETGAAETAAQTAFANDITNIEFVPIPKSLEPGFELTPGANFDSELLTLANAEYASAAGDFQGYLTDLPTNLEALFGGSGGTDLLTGLLGDLGGSTGLGALTGDLGTLLADLGSALF